MRTTAEETQRNDEIILAAAIKVFSEKGYDAASMQDIANEAKISRGPLYYRYKTKKDMFLAAMETYARAAVQEQKEILQQKKPPAEIFRDYLRFATRSMHSNSPSFPLEFFSDPAMDDVNEQIREIYSRSYTFLKQTIAEDVANGNLPPSTDVDSLVNVLYVIYDGLRYSRTKSGVIPSDERLEETVSHICDLLIAGYGLE